MGDVSGVVMAKPLIDIRMNWRKGYYGSQSPIRAMFYTYGHVAEAFVKEANNMTRNCAYEFKTLLIWNIATGKFDPLYDALSPGYKLWKKQQEGSQQGFWKLWGSVQSSFSVRPTPKGYSIGIEKGVMPIRTSSWGTKKKLTPVWMYFWYGEKGMNAFSRNGMNVGEQPPRPVFEPTRDEYRVQFLDKRRRNALDNIAREW
jgi:hypothetical protein